MASGKSLDLQRLIRALGMHALRRACTMTAWPYVEPQWCGKHQHMHHACTMTEAAVPLGLERGWGRVLLDQMLHTASCSTAPFVSTRFAAQWLGLAISRCTSFDLSCLTGCPHLFACAHAALHATTPWSRDCKRKAKALCEGPV